MSVSGAWTWLTGPDDESDPFDTKYHSYVQILTWTPLLMVLSVVAMKIVDTMLTGTQQFSSGFTLIAGLVLLLWIPVVLVAPLGIGYYVRADKAVLSEELDQVNQHFWLTIALYSYLSLGLYPAWYLYVRWRKTKAARQDRAVDPSGSQPDAAKAVGETPPGDAGSAAVTNDSTAADVEADPARESAAATASAPAGNTETGPSRAGDGESAANSEHRERLREATASLREEVERVESRIDSGSDDADGVRDSLSTLESRLAAGIDEAEKRGFDDIQGDLASLEDRRASADAALSEGRRQNSQDSVPERIPGTPDVSVDYQALTDEEPIGSGGHADVTRAALPTDDGSVSLAMKVPRMDGTLHTDDVDQVLAEAETWAKLDDHDHVVGVIDYGSSPLPWIAMEYMDAGHLGDRAGELPADQALWTAIAVTRGVRHAHRRGVAHLDLKPANVLFREVDGAWDAPKVSDWGLSKHLLDHSQSVEGLTPQYAAPEQFDADEYGAPDDITDVYQLGAMFYELFTGRPPFEGPPTSVMRAVMDDDPTPPSDVADVPDGIDEVLLTALEKRKADRYDDIVYLRDALRNVYGSR